MPGMRGSSPAARRSPHLAHPAKPAEGPAHQGRPVKPVDWDDLLDHDLLYFTPCPGCGEDWVAVLRPPVDPRTRHVRCSICTWEWDWKPEHGVPVSELTKRAKDSRPG